MNLFEEIQSSDLKYFPILRERFTVTKKAWDELSLSRIDEIQDSQKQKIQFLLRFCNFCKKWIEEFFEDFVQNENMLDEFQEFLDKEVAVKAPQIHAKLLGSFQKRLLAINEELKKSAEIDRTEATLNTSATQSRCLSPRTSSPPSAPPLSQSGSLSFTQYGSSSFKWNRRIGKLPKGLEFFNYTPAVIARQLTVMDSLLYCAIQPWEVVTPACWKVDSVVKSSHIYKIVQKFNRIGLILSGHILSFVKIDLRAKAMGMWIKVACHCLDYNNYNGAMTIYAGGTSS
jgi:son of sevenless-like protein